MSEEKALVLAQPRDITDEMWGKIAKISSVVAGMYALQPAQAAMAMLRGWELGIPISAAIEMVYVVSTKKGMRTALATQLMNGLIQRSGLLAKMEVKRLDDGKGNCTGYEIYMARTNGFAYRGSFTQKDAEQAGLLGKDNWKSYDDDMYYNRAFAKVGRRVFPDVLLGMYTPEELGATERDGVIMPDTIEDEVVGVTAVTKEITPEPAPDAPPTTLAELLTKRQPSDVTAAAERIGLTSAIPQTAEEVAAVWAELQKGESGG